MLLTHAATHFSSAPTLLGQRAPVETYSPCRSEIQAPLHGVEVTAFFNYFIALAYIILEGRHCCSSSVQAGWAAVYKNVQLLPFFSSSLLLFCARSTALEGLLSTASTGPELLLLALLD